MTRLDEKEIRTIVNAERESRDEKISVLEAKVAGQERIIKEQIQRIEILESKNIIQGIANEYLVRSIDDQNQYLRRQNLIADGLFIRKDATDKDIRDTVINHFKKMKVDIIDEDIVRAHRTGRPYRDNSGKLHVPIIIRFTSWYPRNVVYENRKSSRGVYFRADLTERRQSLLEDITKLLEKDVSMQNLIAYVFADRNCRITTKTTDERYFAVSSVEEFHRLLNFVENTSRPMDLVFARLEEDYQTIVENTNIINLNRIENISEFLEDDETEYIGRKSGNIAASKWQNPYSLNDYDLFTSLDLYKQHVLNTPALIDNIKELTNKKLSCWCHDSYRCHGYVLLELLASSES